MAEMAEEMQIRALQSPDDAGDGGEVDDSGTAPASGYSPEEDKAPTIQPDASPEEVQTLIDCRRSQLEELEMLEAMFADEFCPLFDSTAALEALEAETPNSVAALPPLELLLQMTVPDERSPDETGGKQFIASILLHVGFPPKYPTQGTSPEFRLVDVMITDANDKIGLDKVLWSEVNLDENKLITEMQQMAADMLPDPCVAGVVGWMSENVFSHVM